MGWKLEAEGSVTQRGEAPKVLRTRRKSRQGDGVWEEVCASHPTVEGLGDSEIPTGDRGGGPAENDLSMHYVSESA